MKTLPRPRLKFVVTLLKFVYFRFVDLWLDSACIACDVVIHDMGIWNDLAKMLTTRTQCTFGHFLYVKFSTACIGYIKTFSPLLIICSPYQNTTQNSCFRIANSGSVSQYKVIGFRSCSTCSKQWNFISVLYDLDIYTKLGSHFDLIVTTSVIMELGIDNPDNKLSDDTISR